MNKDFHYEGTYAAAVIAGFRPEAASKIAWAAQTVDECTKSNIDAYYPDLKKWDPVYTCETITENLYDEVSLLSDETSGTLQAVRKIWAPFHFLPGNTMGRIKYKGRETLSLRDIRDFLCMCMPDTDFVAAVVQRVALLFQHAESAAEKENLLIYIGIIMHVLADTWAHQFFTGMPNSCINSVDHVNFINQKPEGYSGSKACGGPTRYSIAYLGHGQAGHNPDYGCLRYTYQASWRENGDLITKNGPDDFRSAFEQMEWALRCIAGIRTQRKFTVKEQFPEDEKDWLTCITDVVTTPKADQSEVWRRQMADFVDYKKLPPYSFAGRNVEMAYFQAYAREHRSFVMSYLQAQLNIMNFSNI